MIMMVSNQKRQRHGRDNLPEKQGITKTKKREKCL